MVIRGTLNIITETVEVQVGSVFWTSIAQKRVNVKSRSMEKMRSNMVDSYGTKHPSSKFGSICDFSNFGQDTDALSISFLI